MPCGNITEPAPGDFYRVSNIDDMLFAFDSLNPEPGVPQRKGPVCELQVCQEARHDFVLDRSIKSVKILGSGGTPGIVPYLISPAGRRSSCRTGQAGQHRNRWHPSRIRMAFGVVANHHDPQYRQSRLAGEVGDRLRRHHRQHPDAVSRVSIHIITDIFPVLVDAAKVAWRSGQAVKGLTFGLADGQGNPVKPATWQALRRCRRCWNLMVLNRFRCWCRCPRPTSANPSTPT
ncbi:hypothetical protein BZL30_9183 [Mycobacterium kansasii]|uniref:Uncharacterized protein n=1 Tax=Mycobacterium kansasii TaxID=1768 RepID=A0A1V3WBM4_MYCKA|nr:hypothetical protein BZL30_9183 [Mycobacterium kansasii]